MHKLAYALGAHAKVDIQILAGVVLFALGGRQNVRGLGADDAHQLFTAIDRYAHAGQDARIHAAHVAHAQRAVLFNIGYHQADFIQMRAQHYPGAAALDMADDAIQRIDPDLVAIGAKGFGDKARRFAFVARKAGKNRDLAQKILCSHCLPSFLYASATILHHLPAAGKAAGYLIWFIFRISASETVMISVFCLV